mgnify:FL=1
MYFDSKRRGKKGLPWTDARTDYEKRSDEYYDKLEELVKQIDDVEANTSFLTELDPDDFDGAYLYVSGRLRELKKYLKRYSSADAVYIEDWLDQLEEIRNELEDMETDALLCNDGTDDDLDWEADDDDFSWDSDDDDDWDDDNDRDDW